jgi:hypothetical protein
MSTSKKLKPVSPRDALKTWNLEPTSKDGARKALKSARRIRPVAGPKVVAAEAVVAG